MRLEQRKAAAIEAWASSIYLNDEVEDTENTYESPAEKLARLTKEEQIYQSYLSGLELASKNPTVQSKEEKEAFEELKTTDKELTELYAVYDSLCEDFYTDYAELNQAGYKLQNAVSALVPEDKQDALDWLSAFYENGAFSADFETMLLATEYYLAEVADRKGELGSYAYDNTDVFNLNGNPDSKRGVNAKNKYLAKRTAVLKEAYEKYIQNAGGKENIEKCASYYGTGQLGYYLQRLTMFYLKNEALSKLSSELKGIINDETYFKWVSWIGLRPYVTDKGKAAEMYKTTVDALRKGNNELLTRDLTMLSMLTEEYSTAKKEYDTLAEAFEKKYYDGGKIADGLSAEKAGKILDKVLGKETATYGDMIPETEADIAKYTERVQILMRPQEPAPEEQNDGTDDTPDQSDGTMGEQTGDGQGENNSDQSGDTDGESEPTTGTEGDDQSEPTNGSGDDSPKALTYSSVVEAFEAILSQKEAELQNAKTTYINGQSEKVNESFKNGLGYLEEALKNYESVDLEDVKKAAQKYWKNTPDTQNFFEEWFNYYGSLLNFESLGKESALLGSAKVIHSIQNYLNAFNEILSEKNRAEYESYREELDKSRKVYSNELASLYQQTLEIERAGLIEWNKAYNKLQDKFTDFQNEFINRWNATTAKWQETVEGFEEEKAQWINAMFMEAESRSLAGLESGSGEAGAAASLKAARDKVSALDDFDYSGLEKSSLVESVLSDSKISAIESLLNNKASSIEQTKSPAFMLKASDEYKLYQAAKDVEKIFEATNKRAEEISARASAQRFRIEIDAKIKESIQKIDDKNTEMKSSFDERAFTEGYTVKNGYYRKKIVKDVSVFSVDSETVKVRMWKDFEANDPEVNLSLLEENVDAVSFSVIMTLVSAQLTDWENSIFGVSGVASTGDDKASTKSVSYIVGEFEKYAYGEQYKGQVELGKGLVGKILLDFENNSQKEKAGWEALDAPTWERKLWCSDTFPGPSIREFSTMVASIAATVCTFGAGAMLAVAVSAAIMAANELTFELADVGVGYHDWDEAAKNVAKAAVSGAISGASGAAMGMASKVGGIGGVFLKTGISSTAAIANNINNAVWSAQSWNGFLENISETSQWQSVAISTVGSFVTNGVGYGLSNTNFTGFNNLQMSQINSIAGTVGGLTTNALEFAIMGETSFNLANLSMLGLEYGSMWGGSATNTLSGGFLSMTIGQNGTHFAISSAGTDISLGTLYSNAMGIGHIVENSKIESYTQAHGQENLETSLRIQYGYGDKESNALLDEILSGKTSLAVSSEKKDGATAQTTTDANGNKTVTLYGISANMSVEEMFKAGLVLQHEAHRDGIDDGKTGQLKETAEAVLAHSDMAAKILDDKLYAGALINLIAQDPKLKSDMEALAVYKNSGSDKDAFAEFMSYVDDKYVSSADYWKVKLDGTIEKTEDKAFYREYIDKDGNLLTEKIKGSVYEGSDTIALIKAVGVIGYFLKLDKIDGTDNYKVAGLGENDSLGVVFDSKTGKYTFFTAGLEFTREDNAFSVYDDGNGGHKDRKNVSYEDRDNTNVTFWMKDVFSGKYIVNESFENAFTSIDNVYYQNSIVSEFFNMRLIDYGSSKYGVNQVGLFSNADTAAGNHIGITGYDGVTTGRYLYHPTDQQATMEGCFGPMSNYGVGGTDNNGKPVWNNPNVVGSGAYHFQQQLNLYHSLGIYNGYQFNVHLKGKLRK